MQEAQLTILRQEVSTTRTRGEGLRRALGEAAVCARPGGTGGGGGRNGREESTNWVGGTWRRAPSTPRQGKALTAGLNARPRVPASSAGDGAAAAEEQSAVVTSELYLYLQSSKCFRQATGFSEVSTQELHAEILNRLWRGITISS